MQKEPPQLGYGSLKSNLAAGLAVIAYFDHGLALVRAAVRADMVRDVVFVAVFAANQMIERQRIVRAAAVTAATRMFSLRQRTHGLAPLNSPTRHDQQRGNNGGII